MAQEENMNGVPPLRAAISRRQLLARLGTGLPLLGLLGVLQQDGTLRAEAPAIDPRDPLAPRPTHFPGRAKRIIHIYLNGGPSQVDTFDPKPLLGRYAGRV